MIHFFNENITYTLKQKSKIKQWITQSIVNEGFNCGNISIILCNDEYLLSINQQYLNHDTYTDIITFDYSEKGVLSGDLFISFERVNENSPSFSGNLYHELLRVIIHGVLHLCGYKDKNPKDQRQMRGKEDEYLSIFFKTNDL